MRILILLIILFLLSVSKPVSASDQTAGWLYDYCIETDMESMRSCIQYLNGYIGGIRQIQAITAGFHDAINDQILSELDNEKTKEYFRLMRQSLCLKHSMTIPEVNGMFLQYMMEHPERMTEEADRVLFDIFYINHGCHTLFNIK